MGRCGQIVMGPAGSGKSTYCARLAEHMQAIGRSVQVVNLDPAADNFNYDVSVDVRELIGLEDVMEEMELGPNGGLIFCMEYLIDNIDWLIDELEQLGNEAYVIFVILLLFLCYGCTPNTHTHIPERKRMAEEKNGRRAARQRGVRSKIRMTCAVCAARRTSPFSRGRLLSPSPGHDSQQGVSSRPDRATQ